MGAKMLQDRIRPTPPQSQPLQPRHENTTQQHLCHATMPLRHAPPLSQPLQPLLTTMIVITNDDHDGIEDPNSTLAFIILEWKKAKIRGKEEREKEAKQPKAIEEAVANDLREWDEVYLKLRPHHQQTIAGRMNPKLSTRYSGPFYILKKVGAVAYKLQVPEGYRIHPPFHVSLLKKVIEEHSIHPSLPANLELDRPPA
ncbi:hypothetical protein CR513_30305, partial [Mucuna pruriens]